MIRSILFSSLLMIGSQVFSQENNLSVLTIDQIMQGEDFVGYLPLQVQWSEDGQHIFFSWNPDGDTIRSTYKVNIETEDISKLTFVEEKNRVEEGDYSSNRMYKVYEKQGDLFLIDLSKMQKKRITNTLERESNPVFSGNDQSIIYRIENNLYSWEIESGSVTQLTDFRKGNEKKESSENEQEEWLETDQLAFEGFISFLRKQ